MMANLSEQLLGRFKVVERVVEESRWPAVRLTDCQLELGRSLASGGDGLLEQRCQNKQRRENGPRGGGSLWCTVCCKRCPVSESRKFGKTPETLRMFVEALLNAWDITKDGKLPEVNFEKNNLTFCLNCHSAIKYFVATLEQLKELEIRIREMKTKFRAVVKQSVSVSQKENKEPVGLAKERNCLRQAIVNDAKRCSEQKHGRFTTMPDIEMDSENIQDYNEDDSIPILSPAVCLSEHSIPEESIAEENDTIADESPCVKVEVGENDHAFAKFDEEEFSLSSNTGEICPDEDNQITAKPGSTVSKNVTFTRKEKSGNIKGTVNARSFNNLPPEKLSQSQGAIYWRQWRAKYPDKSQKEIKEIRKAEAAKKRLKGQFYKKGLVHSRSFLHRPSEKLSQSSAAKAYRKWRLEFPDKSQKEIKELMKQRAAENRKKNTHAKRKPEPPEKVVSTDDGKMFYKNIEILKLETGLYACSKCEYRKKNGASKISSVRAHINLTHAPRLYECSKCKKSFSQDYLLKEHVRLCQRQEKLVCAECGSSFNHQPSLLTHIRVVHKGIKPHTCEHCGNSFATLKDLNIHIRRHTGERPFVCHVCGDTFIEKQSMKKHIQIKHPGANEDIKIMDTRACPENVAVITDQSSFASSSYNDSSGTTKVTNIVTGPGNSGMAMVNDQTGTG